MSVDTPVDGAAEEGPARPPPGQPVAVTLLGAFQVRAGDRVIGPRGLGGGKPRQIFEILVLNAGFTISKTRLVTMLWPDRPPTNALAALESYVSVLRNNLLAVCDSKTSIVRTSVAGYSVAPENLVVDVDQFTRLVACAREATSRDAYDLLRKALARADAPLLVEETASAWADDARRLHTQRITGALIAAADAASSLGKTEQSLRYTARALVNEPHSEAAWIARLTALERAGRHADALRAYGECRTAFAEELGCAPGPSVQRVLRRLLDTMADSDEELADLLVALVRVRDYADGALPDGARTSPIPRTRYNSVVSRPVLEAYQLLEDLLQRARPFPMSDDGERSTG